MPDRGRRARAAIALLMFGIAAIIAPAAAAQPATIAAPPEAAPPAAETPFSRAVASLVPLFTGEATPQSVFAPVFLDAVPPTAFQGLLAQLITAHGRPVSASVVRAPNAMPGIARLTMERAVLTLSISVDAAGRIDLLRIDGVQPVGDTIARVAADVDALPGRSAFGAWRINSDGGLTPIAVAGETAPLPIGSVFKLVILAALDDDIRSGRRHWDDVVRIDRRSIPSGQLQTWPDHAPVTLHSLATLMVSVSDNTAADILLHHLGRERVEAFAATHGGLALPESLPLLSTLELAALRSVLSEDERERWQSGTADDRRAILRAHHDHITPGHVEFSQLGSPSPDSARIEWFATPELIARLYGWFATRASNDARAILSVNAGLPAAEAREWTYVGYKGGSEPGVIALSFLLRDSAGQWFALSGSWSRTDAAVDERAMLGLMTRAAAALRQSPSAGH